MKSAAMPLRALRLAAASVPLVAAFTVVGVGARVGPVGGGCAQASSAHHAALVVEHGDGAVTRVCVSFSGTQVTGEQLLDLSQVPYNTVDFGSYGKAVCQIQGEPTSYPPGCWTASSPYWAMFVSRGGGTWQSSSLGISSQTFGEGDAEGFRYEAQSNSSSPPSPAGICPAPAPVTASPAAVTAPPSTGHASSGNPAARTPTPTSPAVASVGGTRATPSPAPTGPASPTSTVGAVAGVSSGVTTPPQPAGSMSAAAWAAAALGVALLGALVLRVRRSRRGGGASRVTL
jgi:hypothetical protein